jgi:hypothetical protein
MAYSAADTLVTLFRKAALAYDRAFAATGSHDPQASPLLYAFLIELHVNGIPALVLGLSSDGAINRLGSGTWSSIGNTIEHAIIAQTDEPFFRRATELFDPSWLNWEGVHTRSQQRGPPCTLRLSFFCRGLAPIVLELHYGAKSLGPPPEIRRFFKGAVELTQSWYDDENRKEAGLAVTAVNKPWWRFW